MLLIEIRLTCFLLAEPLLNWCRLKMRSKKYVTQCRKKSMSLKKGRKKYFSHMTGSWEISPEYSLGGLMLRLKLQYFGHLL